MDVWKRRNYIHAYLRLLSVRVIPSWLTLMLTIVVFNWVESEATLFIAYWTAPSPVSLSTLTPPRYNKSHAAPLTSNCDSLSFDSRLSAGLPPSTESNSMISEITWFHENRWPFGNLKVTLIINCCSSDIKHGLIDKSITWIERFWKNSLKITPRTHGKALKIKAYLCKVWGGW